MAIESHRVSLMWLSGERFTRTLSVTASKRDVAARPRKKFRDTRKSAFCFFFSGVRSNKARVGGGRCDYTRGFPSSPPLADFLLSGSPGSSSILKIREERKQARNSLCVQYAPGGGGLRFGQSGGPTTETTDKVML